jgi:hypothetical protein
MRLAFCAVLVLLAALAATGCTTRTGAPERTKIAVQEFGVPRDVVVQRYSGRPEDVGMKYAEVLANELRWMGYEATAVPKGVPLEGDLLVTGQIAEMDGGNTAKRLLLGFGAGRSEFDVFGAVSKPEGTIVGEFTESRAGKGWSEEGALKGAMVRNAKLVARMIYTGNYARNAPDDRPAAKVFKAQNSAPAVSTVQSAGAGARPSP